LYVGNTDACIIEFNMKHSGCFVHVMNPNSFPKRPKGSSIVSDLLNLREEKAVRIDCPSVQVDKKNN